MLAQFDVTRVGIPCSGGEFFTAVGCVNEFVEHTSSSWAFHDGPKNIVTSSTPVTPVTGWQEVVLNDSKGVAQ
jgi:hypothetical protein